jgi:hypothetical protein
MKEKLKFCELSLLDNMMCNIKEEGLYDVWEEIENTKDALSRFKKRELFNIALKKIS